MWAMINYVQALAAGNAVRLLLAPAAGAVATRVLRKLTDDIASETDAGAVVVYEGVETNLVDFATLSNGTRYYYRAFDHVGSSWVPSASWGVTPSATAASRGPDPLDVLVQRFEAGLKVECDAARLVHDSGTLPVLTAPPLVQAVRFPLVTMKVTSDRPAYRGLGEVFAEDLYDATADDWVESEGWMSDFQVEITGWVVGNPDGRNALRKALKRIVQANLPVFAAAGMTEIEFSQADGEDLEGFEAPMYFTTGSFSCKAPSIVDTQAPTVHTVTATATSLI